MTFKAISEVKKVYYEPENENKFAEIVFTFTNEGTQKFQRLTKENIKKPIAIVIDKKVVSMPFILQEINSGRCSISGNFTEEEIDKMIEILNEK
jgi:preprotein translocase subunit SecD